MKKRGITAFKKHRKKAVGIIVLQLLTLGIKGLTDIEVIQAIAFPLKWLSGWSPDESSLFLTRWLWLNLYLAIYLALLAGVLSLIRWIQLAINEDTYVFQEASASDLPIYSYQEELATTIQTLENSRDHLEIEDHVEDLLRKIGNTIASSFPIPHSDLRFAFLVSNCGKIEGVRLGRQLSTTDIDVNILEKILEENELTTDIIPIKHHFDSKDVRAIGIVRNPGTFRLGFFIMIPDYEIITDSVKLDFYNKAYMVQYLAFMDKLYEIMVEYSREIKSREGVTGGGLS